jgi:sugar (pentulose or hexulose) kinase
MAKDILLAIDNGTQSVRALLFDLEGNLLAKNRVPIRPYVSPQPGWAEQDPIYFWDSLCQACQGLWQATSIPRESIAGVALTTQRSTLVNIDRQGKPLRPAIVWLDQRRTTGLPRVGGLWGLAFLLSGMTETVAYLQAEAEANWIRTNQPEIWKNTHKLFSCPDILPTGSLAVWLIRPAAWWVICPLITRNCAGQRFRIGSGRLFPWTHLY